MASLNRCTFIGNLGRDPETRYMANGDAVTNISIACTEQWKDKSTGDKREATEWVRVTFYRKLAEIAGQYLKKGSQVYVEGKLQTRKYTDKDGVEKYSTEIIADELKMLGGGPRQDEDEPAKQGKSQRDEPNPRNGAAFKDEIPFSTFMHRDI